MSAHEFDLIDKVVAVLKVKIYDLVEQRAQGINGGVKDLRPMLESELCLQLTTEVTADSDIQQTFWGKSVDVEKMLKFLGISCTEYVDLKKILADKKIKNAYYYKRIDKCVDEYRVSTVLVLLTLAVARLDSINIEEQVAREAREKKAREFLGSDEEIRKVLSVIYKVIFSRIKDGTLRTSDGSGKKVAVIPPNLTDLGTVDEHDCLTGIGIAAPAAKILRLLGSLHYNSNVLGNRPEDRRAFIEWLLEIVQVAREGDQAGEDSEKAILHRSIYSYVCMETQAILDAIRILHPVEVAELELKAKEPKIASVAGGDKLETKGKELETDVVVAVDEQKSSDEEQERPCIDVDEANKKIDDFIQWMKKQPKGPLEWTYSKCIDELIARHDRYVRYVAAFDHPAKKKSELIMQFKQDVLKIIEAKKESGNKISRKLDGSCKKLIALEGEFLRQTAFNSTGSSNSASSSSSDSPARSSGEHNRFLKPFQDWKRSSLNGDRGEKPNPVSMKMNS